MTFMDFQPIEQPAAILGPQEPMVFLRETNVLGRAGARGGAGAERGGNDCDLVKLTIPMGDSHENKQNVDNIVFSLKSMKIS